MRRSEQMLLECDTALLGVMAATVLPVRNCTFQIQRCARRGCLPEAGSMRSFPDFFGVQVEVILKPRVIMTFPLSNS